MAGLTRTTVFGTYIFRFTEQRVLPRESMSLKEGVTELRLEQSYACAVGRFLSSATTLLSYKLRTLETEITILSHNI